MAYKNGDLTQSPITQEDFEKEIEWIEMVFTKEIAKPFDGTTLYYLKGGIFNQNYFVKTTVSDLRDVMGNDDGFGWIDNSNSLSNPTVNYISLNARKGEFRGRLKATPPNTFVYSISLLGFRTSDKNEMSEDMLNSYKHQWVSQKYPVVQDEKFLNAACDNAFESDEYGVDYDYIMGHSIKFLDHNKTLSIGGVRLKDDVMVELSKTIQTGLCLMHEAKNVWAISYDWNGVDFRFPMTHENMRNVLKNRDKIDGRKSALPTLRKEHYRSGTLIPRHMTNMWNTRDKDRGITMNGRMFRVFIDTDAMESGVLNHEAGIKRVRKELYEAEN